MRQPRATARRGDELIYLFDQVDVSECLQRPQLRQHGKLVDHVLETAADLRAVAQAAVGTKVNGLRDVVFHLRRTCVAKGELRAMQRQIEAVAAVSDVVRHFNEVGFQQLVAVVRRAFHCKLTNMDTAGGHHAGHARDVAGDEGSSLSNTDLVNTDEDDRTTSAAASLAGDPPRQDQADVFTRHVGQPPLQRRSIGVQVHFGKRASRGSLTSTMARQLDDAVVLDMSHAAVSATANIEEDHVAAHDVGCSSQLAVDDAMADVQQDKEVVLNGVQDAASSSKCKGGGSFVEALQELDNPLQTGTVAPDGDRGVLLSRSRGRCASDELGKTAGDHVKERVIELGVYPSAFRLRHRPLGDRGAFAHHIQSVSGARLWLQGSPLKMHLYADNDADLDKAFGLAQDLVATVALQFQSWLTQRQALARSAWRSGVDGVPT
jgi:hypothetical protein